MIGAKSVRFDGHHRTPKAKKNRHTLGFPVCGGVLNGGLAGIESPLETCINQRLLKFFIS
jgi:hypothetical protein